MGEAFDFDESCRAGGVELFDRGGEDHIRALGLGERTVNFKAAGINGEVLMGAELGGVDEDADGDLAAGGAGGADQRGVAGVESAHGGDEADQVSASVPFFTGPLAELGDGVEDFHQAFRNVSAFSISFRVLCAVSGR